MKKHLLSCLIALLTSITISQAQKAYMLQEGTVVRIRLLETLDSRISRPGSHVYMEVADDVEVEGKVVVERGAKVMGTVVEATEAKMFGRKGKLSFSIDYVQASNGKNLRLRTMNSSAGQDRVGGVVAAAALVNPLLVFIKGKNTTVEKGTEFQVYVDKDYELEYKK